MRRFRTESEYKAAKRDLKLIEEIKSNVHMEQPGEVISLCDALAEGKYRFESVIGNDFDVRDIRKAADCPKVKEPEKRRRKNRVNRLKQSALPGKRTVVSNQNHRCRWMTTMAP